MQAEVSAAQVSKLTEEQARLRAELAALTAKFAKVLRESHAGLSKGHSRLILEPLAKVA